MTPPPPGPARRQVQLFATCLAESFYPNVLRDTVGILEHLGVVVDFPRGQTCCGQPLFNSGFHEDARSVARGFRAAFRDHVGDIVSPSPWKPQGGPTTRPGRRLPGVRRSDEAGPEAGQLVVPTCGTRW